MKLNVSWDEIMSVRGPYKFAAVVGHWIKEGKIQYLCKDVFSECVLSAEEAANSFKVPNIKNDCLNFNRINENISLK